MNIKALESTSVLDKQKPTKVLRARDSIGALEFLMQPGCKHWQEVRRAHTVHKLGMNRQSKMEYIVQLSSAEMINYCFKTAV